MNGHGDSQILPANSFYHFSLTNVPVLHAYSHHMTSYLETAGAVFKAYDRYYQLIRVLCEPQFSSASFSTILICLAMVSKK